MIELPPKLSLADITAACIELLGCGDASLRQLVDECREEYAYWSDVKYKKVAGGMTPYKLWSYVKGSRMVGRMEVWPRYGINMSLTNRMQRVCHDLDMDFGGSWGNDVVLPEKDKSRYLVSSLMEEAISSSQMEGASTTRKVAKEMLRRKMTPRDKSQQMIYNNYHTIKFIAENKDKPLTEELLLEVHSLMTAGTLDNPGDAGRFRTSDDVVVEDGITHEVVHVPPSHEDIPSFVSDLCVFFNDESPAVFIHPIIRGIVIHFMLAYMHPFVDGNGRTARALFYWYMLKEGYWLTEYLSISRIIARSKKTYERTFLYSEADGNDIGYFVTYNLRVLDLAFKELRRYIKRKTSAKAEALRFIRLGSINERQAGIVREFHSNPGIVLTVKDVQLKFGVTPTTAKSDISGLQKLGLLSEIALNKIKKGYVKSEAFDKLVSKGMQDL